MSEKAQESSLRSPAHCLPPPRPPAPAQLTFCRRSISCCLALRMARACSCSNSSCCRRSAASRMCWGGRRRHTGQVSPAPCREPHPGSPHSQPAPWSDSPPASPASPWGGRISWGNPDTHKPSSLCARFLFNVPGARERSCRFLCGGESLFSLFGKILSLSPPPPPGLLQIPAKMYGSYPR